jgi:hypothetical protein
MIDEWKTRLNPIFGLVDQFRNKAFCYFIAQDFGRFKNTYCNNLGNSIQFLTLALFIVGFSCFGITWFSRWSSYRIQFVPRVAPAPFDENGWMVQNGYAPGAPQQGGVAHGGYAGVQLAQVEDQPTNNYQATESGEAMNVPPYQAALASYKAPEQNEPAYGEQQQQQNDGQWQQQQQEMQQQQEEQQQEQQQQQQSEPETGGNFEHEQAQAEAAAAAAAEIASPSCGAPDLPGQSSEEQTRPTCESCESEPVAVNCQECEEDLCATCDATLHKSAANAGHTRNAL